MEILIKKVFFGAILFCYKKTQLLFQLLSRLHLATVTLCYWPNFHSNLSIRPLSNFDMAWMRGCKIALVAFLHFKISQITLGTIFLSSNLPFPAIAPSIQDQNHLESAQQPYQTSQFRWSTNAIKNILSPGIQDMSLAGFSRQEVGGGVGATHLFHFHPVTHPSILNYLTCWHTQAFLSLPTAIWHIWKRICTWSLIFWWACSLW